MHIETKETIITSKPDLIKVSKLSTNNYELEVPKADKNEAEKGTSNSKSMTPLQTKNAIEYNNINVIPDLVKEHETETEITSLSEHLTVDKKSKNNFEIGLDLPEGNGGNETLTKITSNSKKITVEEKSQQNFDLDSTNILDGKSTEYSSEVDIPSILLNSVGLLDYINILPKSNIKEFEIYKGTTDDTIKQFKIVISNKFQDNLLVSFKNNVFKNMSNDSGDVFSYSIDLNNELILTIFKLGEVYYLESVIGGRSEPV